MFTFQCFRLSLCSMEELNVTTPQLLCDFRLLIVTTTHATAHGSARSTHSSSLTSHSVFWWQLKFFWSLSDSANHVLFHWSSSVYLRRLMFLSERGRLQLLSPEPITSEVRGHHYISSAVRHNPYSESSRNILRFYRRAAFEEILKLDLKHRCPQTWHQFYWTVWGMITMSISSKCFQTSTLNNMPYIIVLESQCRNL